MDAVRCGKTREGWRGWRSDGGVKKRVGVGPRMSNPGGQDVRMTIQFLSRLGASFGALVLAWMFLVLLFCLG